jgi:hypothetical protein
MVSIIGAILTKRREKDAVLESNTSNSQGLEELGNGLVVWLGIGCCSGGRMLHWGEVLDAWKRTVDHRLGHVVGGLVGVAICLTLGDGVMGGDGHCCGGVVERIMRGPDGLSEESD